MIAGTLEALGAAVLQWQQQDNAFILHQPDIVGMYYDTLACGLSQPALARLLLAQWIEPLIAKALELLPECNHPKVLCAVLLTLSRLTGVPPALVPAPGP